MNVAADERSAEPPRGELADELTRALGLRLLEDDPSAPPGLGAWAADNRARAVAALMRHGDFARWLGCVQRLTQGRAGRRALEVDAPSVTSLPGSPAPERGELGAALRGLGPWRKGPFELYGISLDAEWNCAEKWRRLLALASPFTGRRVLDVGAGNGYYSLRLLGAGARFVVAVEPSVAYSAQYLALARLLEPAPLSFWPLRWEQWAQDSGAFDTALSLGVLYHRREPLEHLRSLRGALRHDGELVLETLVVPGEAPECLVPTGRYARMRNTWSIPTRALLARWLGEAGFVDVRFGPVVRTTSDEQRATAWCPGPSLRESLAPDDPDLTCEGHPAPRRIVAVARRR